MRVETAEGQELNRPARRSKHDAILSTVGATVRGDVGAVTSTGRLLRFSPVDLPSVPASSVQLAAGTSLREYLGITTRSEKILALVDLASEVPIALGTQQGIVKRIVPATLPVRPETEIIALKTGDSLVGAAPAPDVTDIVFVTSDAQLLHYSSAMVRPQGAPAGGMAGVKLSAGATVLSFTVVDPAQETVVVTVSGTEGAIAGTDPGRAKTSAYSDFPAKGRATGGVRAHAFLKGEDRLIAAWVGPSPAYAVGPDGAVRKLPDALVKRDASGVPVDSVIGSIGRPIV